VLRFGLSVKGRTEVEGVMRGISGPKGKEVIEGCRKLRNGVFHSLC
jgi:hypothetical protein